MRIAAQRAGLVVGGLILSALAFEVLLRALTLPTYLQEPFTGIIYTYLARDPVAGWVNRASFQRPRFRINGLGFRGPEIREPRGPGTQRIVCLGDSGTFGSWAEKVPGTARGSRLRFENYPQELRSLLSSKIEVINAGVTGYTSSHGLRQLQTQILGLEPDIITVRFGLNDHKKAWDPALVPNEPPALLRTWFYGVSDWRLARLLLNAAQRSKFLHPAPRSVRWVSLQQFYEDMWRFSEISRELGIRILLIDYPLRPLEWGEYAGDTKAYKRHGHESLRAFHQFHDEYQAAMRNAAIHWKTPILLTRDVMESASPRAFSTVDLVHPNDEGARLIARLLLRKLLELGWISDGDVGSDADSDQQQSVGE